MPDPYIPKSPNDLIRAADWNQIQIETRTDIEQHGHTGGEDGSPLGTDALADGAVQTAKLADSAVTAAKLAPDVADAITPGPGSITSEQLADGAVQEAKIADGAVTAAKLAAPLSLPDLRADALRLAGYPMRPVLDYASVEWSWTLEQREQFLYGGPLDGFGTLLNKMAQAILDLAGGMANPEFLRALRVLSDHIEPDFLRMMTPRPAFESVRDRRLDSALERLRLDDLPRALDEALNILDIIYDQSRWEYNNILLAVARQCNTALVKDVIGMNNGSELNNIVIERYPLSAFEVMASNMLPPDALPPLVLDVIEGFDDVVMEVEIRLQLMVSSDICLLGIGTEEAPMLRQITPVYQVPELGRIPQSVVLRRRIWHRPGLKRQRFARLCGFATGSSPASIRDMQISARTLGGRDPVASTMSVTRPSGTVPIEPTPIEPTPIKPLLVVKESIRKPIDLLRRPAPTADDPEER